MLDGEHEGGGVPLLLVTQIDVTARMHLRAPTYIICFHTALRRPLLLVAQTDVTARTLLEMAMAKITEREFDMLGQVGARLLMIDRAGDWRGAGAKGKGGCAVMRQVCSI